MELFTANSLDSFTDYLGLMCEFSGNLINVSKPFSIQGTHAKALGSVHFLPLRQSFALQIRCSRLHPKSFLQSVVVFQR